MSHKKGGYHLFFSPQRKKSHVDCPFAGVHVVKVFK